jgi:outer membrane biosynthesis protein TonB
MPRVAASVPVLALGLAAAFALASCGSGSDAKLLPGETAREISENLDTVQQLVDEEECIDAEDAALQVSTQVEALEGIDPELKQVLERGAARLNVVVDACEETTEDTVEETIPETTESTEEKPEKKEKEPKKVEPEETIPEEEEAETGPEEKELPPQAKGEAKGHEKEPPPVEEESGEPSGGIGPGSETGAEG